MGSREAQGQTVGRSQVARSLLQAGVWAATGKPSEALQGATDFGADAAQVREALIVCAVEEKMAPMLAHFVESTGLDLGEAVPALAEVARVLTDTLYTHLVPIVDEVSKAGIEMLLLKGADLDLMVYPPEVSRFMEDVDLMVRAPDLPAIERIFREAGFQQGNLEKQDLRVTPLSQEEKAAIEADHFELLPFFKIVPLPALQPLRPVVEKYLLNFPRLIVVDDDVYLALGYDVHHNIATNFDIRHIWTDLRIVELPGGQELRGQSFSDMLWFLAVRMYHEVALHNQKAMRLFVDTMALAHRCASEIDWHRVMAMAEEYKLHPSLFFVFWHINELLGPTVPEWMVEACNPTRGAIDRSHDWGDFLPKMFGEVVTVPAVADGNP